MGALEVQDGRHDQEARVAEAGAGSREVREGLQGETRLGDHQGGGGRGQGNRRGLRGNQRAEEGLEAGTGPWSLAASR